MELCVKLHRFDGHTAEANPTISFGVAADERHRFKRLFAGTYQDENPCRSGQQKL